MYYKPYLKDHNQPLDWLKNITHPISKSVCAIQGFKCPTHELCDCEQFCNNGTDFVPYKILPQMKGHIYTMNQKLAPGAYCLPKGVESCNLNTSYHIFSRAGWSCIPIHRDMFTHHKKTACQNEEAQDNKLNVLYDSVENKNVDHEFIENYYEKIPGQDVLRYRCQCNSRAFDGTPMISVFPFVCSVDFCLRDIKILTQGMGWNIQTGICECGVYPHLNPNDLTSPCRTHVSKIENNVVVGRVDCMTANSFVKYPLICPPGDEMVTFTQSIMDGNDPHKLLDILI